MRKVSVAVQIDYNFTLEVPEDKDILTYCDTEDPVFGDIAGIFYNSDIPFGAEIVSIIDNNTGELLGGTAF